MEVSMNAMTLMKFVVWDYGWNMECFLKLKFVKVSCKIGYLTQMNVKGQRWQYHQLVDDIITSNLLFKLDVNMIDWCSFSYACMELSHYFEGE